VGETTIMGQKVVELAGDAANGVKGHVGLTIDAPTPAIRAFAAKYEKEFKSKSDHNGIKGYTGMYVVKAVTEKVGKFDRKGFAQAIKNSCFSAKQNPGLLMDVCFDDRGDIDRESFLVEVKGGKQVVVETLPPLGKK
jgi:branched-chain amino acid transport system substrate-binding protein